MTTTTNHDRYMQDSQGRLVPVSLVSDFDKLRDQTVRRIADDVMRMKALRGEFK